MFISRTALSSNGFEGFGQTESGCSVGRSVTCRIFPTSSSSSSCGGWSEVNGFSIFDTRFAEMPAFQMNMEIGFSSANARTDEDNVTMVSSGAGQASVHGPLLYVTFFWQNALALVAEHEKKSTHKILISTVPRRENQAKLIASLTRRNSLSTPTSR